MKGLVFGNSHVGAIRLGSRQVKTPKLDFYSIQGGNEPNVKIIDGRIFPAKPTERLYTTLGSAETDGLDLSPYDFILFTSLGYGPIRERYPQNLLRKVALVEHRQPGATETIPVSRGFLENAMRVVFSRKPGLAAIRQLRSIFRGPMFCAPLPLPVMSRIGEDHPLRRTYGPEAETFITWFASIQLKLIHEALGDLDPEITILKHPDPAWLAAGALPAEYISANGDTWHANGRYGTLVLEQVCAALSRSVAETAG